MLLYVFYFAQLQHANRRPTYSYIAKTRNSCLPTRIHPVYLKKSLKTFYIKFTLKKCNNWHIISFIHSGNEKFTDTGFVATS